MRVLYCFLFAGIIFLFQNCSDPDKVFTENFPFQKADKVVIYSKLADSNDAGMFPVGIIVTDSLKNAASIISGNRNPLDSLAFLEKYYKKFERTDPNFVIGLQKNFSPMHDVIKRKNCAPVYRDIIVYYRENKPFACAKICFSCNHMLFYPDSYGKSNENFDELKEFWIRNKIKTEKDFE